MSNWNGLDFFIFLIFFLNTIVGMSRGATKEIISIMCLSAALIFTIRFTVPLAAFLDRSPLIQDVLTSSPIQNFMRAIGADPLTADMLHEIGWSLSALICFVGVFCATDVALNSSFAEVFTFPWAIWNRKVGAVLGCTRGYVINLMFIMILTLHLFSAGNRDFSNQFLANSWFIGLFQAPAIKLNNLIMGQEVENYQKVFEDRNLFNAGSVTGIVSPSGVIPPQGGQVH